MASVHRVLVFHAIFFVNVGSDRGFSGYSVLFGLIVDTHFFKVVFMPVDRRLAQTVPKPVVVPQVQFLAVVLVLVLA